MNEQERHEQRVGLAAALAAYLAWGGVMPAFFRAMAPVNPVEIIAHRVVWAIPVLLVFLLVRDGRQLWTKLKLTKRQYAWLTVSGCLIGANWLIFVWAVGNGQVLATSLGYFINPLMNFLFGFMFLGERLNRPQKWAVAIAAAGTAYLAWYMGQAPWVSLLLALSFALYSLVRKRLDVGPMTGLLWENVLLLTPTLAFFYWAISTGSLQFGSLPGYLDTMLVLAGFMTVLPLIWFNMAAQRLTLTMIGFIQYLAPTISFMLAVFLWDEPFTRGHAVAFGCIWFALALVSVAPLRNRLRGLPLD